MRTPPQTPGSEGDVDAARDRRQPLVHETFTTSREHGFLDRGWELPQAW
ncbi:MAG TPA: hypothetical protein VKY90_21470 [Candidatus Dormibacteraeota bacterium]|nr:hypothetical protein [Candidatus Dormibacteraeota bacterium]